MKEKWLVVVALLALASLGCLSLGVVSTVVVSTPPPAGDIIGEAGVESVEVLILESLPVQVQVVARGNLPDGCTRIDQVLQEREDNTFRVTITTLRPADLLCTEALVPFEQVIPLDVYGLPAGIYTVTVNGVNATFELTVDNVPPAESLRGSRGTR